MKHEMKKTDGYVRKARAIAGKLAIRNTKNRAFDAVAYAAALEVLG
jgi:hypothetical protein